MVARPAGMLSSIRSRSDRGVTQQGDEESDRLYPVTMVETESIDT
jgi:hypothetical protein